MLTTYLVVLFFYGPGEPVLLEGWYPRVQESMEICEVKKQDVHNYLAAIKDPDTQIAFGIKGFKVECVEIESI